MNWRLGILIGLSLIVWLLVVIPSRWLWGDEVALCSVIGLGLCLVPTALTLTWAGWAFGQSTEQQFLAVFGGSGVRMFVVLGSALALHQTFPYLQQQPSFWWWILLFYLVTLAIEMTLLLLGHDDGPGRFRAADDLRQPVGPAAEERHGA